MGVIFHGKNNKFLVYCLLNIPATRGKEKRKKIKDKRQRED